jgi:hypothetical protein
VAGTDDFVAESESPVSKTERVKILTAHTFKEGSYEVDTTWKPGNPDNPLACKTVAEMIECLDKHPEVGLDAQFLAVNPKTGARQSYKVTKENRSAFIESYKARDAKFKESGSFDGDGYSGNVNQGLVGNDFVPLLGGPFDKQLYYQDFMMMQAAAFWAYHHDPFAHAIVHIILDFTLGKGFRIDFEDKKQQALWEAFTAANNFKRQFLYFAKELSIYGESQWWWLPKGQTQINWQRRSGETPAPTSGVIPRIRVMDPSLFWDKITHPEDINTILAYQWVAPTQYQIYTQVNSTGERVPSSKFIYRQIPGEEIIEQKINCVSNEKRGRSDLFSVLGYLKRLRDTVNWSIIGMQKAAAFAIDTTIEGNQADIDAYISDQASNGSVAPAGSEFVHTKKIERKYIGNAATDGAGKSGAFDWTLNMIAAGSRIPVSYFGTHLSGGSTRASAIVATEPVAKLFESRQQVYDDTLQDIIKGWAQMVGIGSEYKVKITWPEIITQDRSQKLKDLAMAEQALWISPQRAAETAAKELGADDFIYANEQAQIKKQQDAEIAPGPLQQPLTQPGKNGGGGLNQGGEESPGLNGVGQSVDKPSAVTGAEKAKIKQDLRQ